MFEDPPIPMPIKLFPRGSGGGRPVARSKHFPAAIPQARVRAGLSAFRCNGYVYQGVDAGRAKFMSRLCREGVIRSLVEQQLLVETELTDSTLQGYPLVLRQRATRFETLPHEWSAPALRDAARVLLDFSLQLARRGLALKNVRPGCVQFQGGRPLVVDVTSLAPIAGAPSWAGYAEFANQFLYPLTLMAHGHDTAARELLARGGVRSADLLQRVRGPALPSALLIELKANSIIRRLLRKVYHVAYPIRAARLRPPGIRRRDLVVRHLEGAREDLENLAPLVGASPLPNVPMAQRRLQRLVADLQPRGIIDASGHYRPAPDNRGIGLISLHPVAASAAGAYATSRSQETGLLPLVIDVARPFSTHRPAPYERLRCDMVIVSAVEGGLLSPIISHVITTLAALMQFGRRWLVVQLPAGAREIPAALATSLDQRFDSVTRFPGHGGEGSLLVCER